MNTRERLLNDDDFLVGCLYQLCQERLLQRPEKAILHSFYIQHQRTKSLTSAQIKTCRNKLAKYLRDIINLDYIPSIKNKTFIIKKQIQEPAKKAKSIQPDILHGELYQFQKEGVGWLEANDGCGLITDQMGLGKTVQSLGWLALHPEARPALIIVPASVKLNWQREINKWFKEPQDISILSGRTPNESLLSANINIINYDILAPQRKQSGWKDMLIAFNHKTIILDEAHKIKSSKSKRTKAVKIISSKIPHRIALTGTPVMNRPIEIFNAINLIQPDMFKYWTYVQRYCNAKKNRFGWDVNGSSNEDELHKILTKKIMLRRLKKDVLKELPEKQINYIPMQIDNRKEYFKAENFFIEWLKTKNRKKAEKAKGAETLVQIEYLKQLSAEGKLISCIEWINDFLETGEKLVLFATHKKILDSLQSHFKKSCVRISGGINLEQRDKAVQDFQNKDSVRLIINNIQAGGLGIDGLQNVCSNTCFLEFPWSPLDMEQAEDRIHRIGQKGDSVNIYYLLGLDTIDEKIIKLMQKKMDIINAVIDGKETDELYYTTQLLSELKNNKKNLLYIV